jgi:hypothetical protein
VFVDWDGSLNVTCLGCTLGSGPEPSNYVTYYFWNGGGPSVFHSQDTIFQGAANKNSVNMTVPENNDQTADVFIDWSYNLSVVSGTGEPVSGATVTATSAQGTEVTGTTNAQGQVSLVLTEQDIKNNVTTVHNPYTVVISEGGQSVSFELTIQATTSVTETL